MKTIRLTMKELMSLEVGLDTGEEEFIDKDGLDMVIQAEFIKLMEALK